MYIVDIYAWPLNAGLNKKNADHMRTRKFLETS